MNPKPSAPGGVPRLSPKRRFLKAFFGAQPDRVPVGNLVSIATVELMKAAGAWFPSAHLDAQAMAELAAAGHTHLGYDTVMPVFSVTQEAAALGCVVDWGAPDMMPGVRSHPFAQTDNPRLPEGWMDTPPIQVVLEALRRLRRALGEQVVIVGKVMGPWSLSYQMVGIEEFLISTKTEPERVRRWLEALKEVSIAFAREQMRAGADLVCVADHTTGGMVSPLVYRDLVLPLHQEMVGRLGCPTVLHCCGNTTDRLHYFAQAGFDCYHFESQVDPKTAVAAAAGQMSLAGNVNNPEVLLHGTPEAVAAACQRALAAGVNILAPECAVPLTTPLRNLRVLVDVTEAALSGRVGTEAGCVDRPQG
jgi:[methyl-Co(III) methanol-specific corrinoid protein]:coenzyme M methyltransferase